MEAPYIQGEDSHTYGGEDLDFEDVADDESQDSSVQATGLHREVERERERWKTLNLEEKFKEVITLLTDNWRWSGELDLTAGSHRKLLEGWMKQSLLNDWLESDRTSPTFLHLLARKGKEFRLLHKKDRLTMVKDALEHRTTTATSTASRPHHYHQQHLAQPRNSHEEPVMNLAVFSDNNAFIDCVIDCWPDGVSDLIKETCRESRNCLHNIFMTWRPNRPPSKQERIKAQHIARISALEKGKKLLPWASAEAITAKDNTGNTPLHYAMWFRQCSYRDEDYVQMVRNMLEKGDYLMEATGGSLNQAGQSPILYYHHTAMSPKGVKEAGGPNKKEAVPGPRLQLQPPVTQPPTTSKEPQHHKSLNSKTQLMERPKQLLEKLPMQGHFIQRPVRKPAIAPPVSNDTHHNNRATGRPREEPTLTSHGSRPPTPKPIKATAWDSLFSIDMPPPPISRAATTTIANAAPDDSPEQTPKRTDERQQGGPENLSGPKLIDIFTKHYIRTRSDLEARNLIYGLNKSGELMLADRPLLRVTWQN